MKASEVPDPVIRATVDVKDMLDRIIRLGVLCFIAGVAVGAIIVKLIF